MDIEIKSINCLNLAETLDCGQAFRWKETEDGRWGSKGDHGPL